MADGHVLLFSSRARRHASSEQGGCFQINGLSIISKSFLRQHIGNVQVQRDCVEPVLVSICSLLTLI